MSAPIAQRTPATVDALFKARRLSPKCAAFFKVRDVHGGVEIPYPGIDGKIATSRIRQFTETAHPTKWSRTGGPVLPFTNPAILKAARKQRAIVFVEGETDVFTLVMHAIPAIGIPGATMVRHLTAPYVEGISRIYVVRESDAAGRTFVDGIATRLAEIEWLGELLVIDLHALYGVKDPSELHVLDPDQFLERWNHARDVATGASSAAPIAEPLQSAQDSREEREPEVPSVESVVDGDDIDRILAYAEHHDLGATELYVSLFGDSIRYVRQAKGFYVRDAGRWVPDSGDRVLSYAQSVSKKLYGLAATLDLGKEQRERLARFGLKFESRKLMETVVALARGVSTIGVDASAFDADPFLLNTPNGVLDTRTGNLRPRRGDELFSKLTGAQFDPDATCPRWLQFLEEVFCGNVELIDFVHRLVGLSITGSQSEQVLPICYGAGSNGKSTFLDVLGFVLGDYAMSTGSDTFMRDRKGATNDLARLAGSRFVSAVEVEDGKSLSEALVKSVTGGDPITARFLFKEFFQFVPQFTLWLAVNHRPIIKGSDNGIWRRLRLIPFEARFEGAARDNNLAQRLRDEAPGILAWAMRGCLAWQADGLQTPAAVQAATDSYRSDMDVLRPFLDDCCAIDPQYSVATADLYGAYRRWAESNGERPVTAHTFGRRLADRGYRPERQKHARFWRGLALQNGDTVTQVTLSDPLFIKYSREEPLIRNYTKHDMKASPLSPHEGNAHFEGAAVNSSVTHIDVENESIV